VQHSTGAISVSFSSTKMIPLTGFSRFSSVAFYMVHGSYLENNALWLKEIKFQNAVDVGCVQDILLCAYCQMVPFYTYIDILTTGLPQPLQIKIYIKHYAHYRSMYSHFVSAKKQEHIVCFLGEVLYHQYQQSLANI
jgi:hypothetical protein